MASQRVRRFQETLSPIEKIKESDKEKEIGQG